MESIHHRLQYSLEVYNPVDPSQELTYKNEYINQVSHFKDKLGDAIRWLSPLFEDCPKEDALKAWGKVFNHSYWAKLAEEIEEAKALGEQLRAAKAAGSLYSASPSGQLFTSRPQGKSVQVPNNRYYGEEK